MNLGTVAAIWRYPVKSLRGESLDGTEVAESGIPGDRVRALVVKSGHARAGKTYRGKEHDRLHLTSSVETAVELGATRGVFLERRGGERFFDDAPISLLLDHWLDELSDPLGYTVEPERFRPNFFVRARPDFTAGEASLQGAEVRLGEATLRVRYPIERCVTITYDPFGGASDPRILRLVAERRNGWMGVYCDVARPGRVRTGDSLVLFPSA
ncbi:MAG: MOSC domain-containing protein [Candidatus Tumulicola sp.]